MLYEHDAAFLTRREAQERALANGATDPASRHIHLDLAERYAARLVELSTPAPRVAA